MEFQNSFSTSFLPIKSPMNRFFKIAGDFLESVDQRADRSVNCISSSFSFIF